MCEFPKMLGRIAALAIAVLAIACGDATGTPNPPLPFTVELSTTVQGNAASFSVTMTGGAGVVTSLLLTKSGGAAQQLDPGTRSLQGLDWLASYTLCATAKTSDGKSSDDACDGFTTPANPDRCVRPTADTVGTVKVIIEFVPDNPNPGAAVWYGTGRNCDGSSFTGDDADVLFYLKNDGRMSYRAEYWIKPNKPGGSKPIILRWPMFNQGAYLYDAVPTGAAGAFPGTFYVNGVKVSTVTADSIPPSAKCMPNNKCVSHPGIEIKNLDATGHVW